MRKNVTLVCRDQLRCSTIYDKITSTMQAEAEATSMKQTTQYHLCRSQILQQSARWKRGPARKREREIRDMEENMPEAEIENIDN